MTHHSYCSEPVYAAADGLVHWSPALNFRPVALPLSVCDEIHADDSYSKQAGRIPHRLANLRTLCSESRVRRHRIQRLASTVTRLARVRRVRPFR